jgi:hypothetical protein
MLQAGRPINATIVHARTQKTSCPSRGARRMGETRGAHAIEPP